MVDGGWLVVEGGGWWWLVIWVDCFVVGWFLLVERHVVNELLKFLMHKIGYKSGLVGGVAGSLAGEMVLHAVIVFSNHDSFESGISFGNIRFGSPDF